MWVKFSTHCFCLLIDRMPFNVLLLTRGRHPLDPHHLPCVPLPCPVPHALACFAPPSHHHHNTHTHHHTHLHTYNRQLQYIKDHFAGDIAALASGGYDSWLKHPLSAVAGIVLADQFTRCVEPPPSSCKTQGRSGIGSVCGWWEWQQQGSVGGAIAITCSSHL